MPGALVAEALTRTPTSVDRTDGPDGGGPIAGEHAATPPGTRGAARRSGRSDRLQY